MPSFTLRNPQSDACCEIELGLGRTYSIAVASNDIHESVLDQLLRIPGTQIADSVGGMVSNIDLLENISLPAVFHRTAPAADIARQALEIFAACDVDSARAGDLFRMHPGEIGAFEKRVAGFVRGLLMRPQVMVYSRFLDGLTRSDMTRALGLNAVFGQREPGGTAIYLMQRDMPVLQPESWRQFEL